MITAATHPGSSNGPRGPVRSRRARIGRGFTLFELVLVMAIITIVLGMVAPSLRGFAHGARMRDAATQFVAVCQWARTQSIATARVHRLHIDTSAAQYRVMFLDGDEFVSPTSDFGKVFAMPEGYNIAVTKLDGSPGTTVDFLPNGRTEPARVVITAQDGERSLVECPTPAETFRVVPPGEVTR